MELRQIEYFIQLYKDSNITKASKNLFISQQGLSKSINRLEEELGFPLFERSASGVEPTPSADELYDYFNKISNSYYELELAIDNIRQNRILKIVAYHGFVLSSDREDLGEYSRLYPSATLHYDEDYNNAIPDYLLSRQADIAFMAAPIPHELISHQVISREPVCAVMGRTHPLASHGHLTLSDLANQKFLLLDVMEDYNTEILGAADSLDISYEITDAVNMNIFLPFIGSCPLIGLAPRGIFRYHSFPDIVFIPLCSEGRPAFTLETHLVTSGDLNPDEETQQYIDYIKEKFQDFNNPDLV